MLASRLNHWLSSPRFPRLAVLLACVLSSPALSTPLIADDIWHRAMLHGDRSWVPVRSGPLSLYTFATGNPEEGRAAIENGFAPWFASTGVRLSFFRPVSSLLITLDHTLWPSSPVLMHAHSIAWYLIVVFLASKLYVRLLGPLSFSSSASSASSASSGVGAGKLAAGIATLFYAIDYTHGMPVAWVANRNALVSAAFALGALLLHDMSATSTTTTPNATTSTAKSGRSSLFYSIAAAASLALGLGAGEGAVGILFFLGAHAVFLDDRPLRSRLVSLAPCAVVVLAWVIAYRVGNYGVVGSGVYLEPIHSPRGYLESVAQNAPLLVGTEIGAAIPDVYVFVPPMGKAAFLIAAGVAIAWASFVFSRFLRAHNNDRRTRRVACFFVASSALSVLPISATFPSARLLMLTGFGFVAALAMLCAATMTKSSWTQESRVVRAYAGWSWFGHLVLAPFLFILGIQQMPILDAFNRRLAVGIPSDGSAADKRLVLVTAPDTTFAYYFIITHLEEGRSPPTKMVLMTGNTRDVTITRTAEGTFVVHCAEGFYRRSTDLLFRDPQTSSMPLGTKVELSDVTITITHVTSDGYPDEASFVLTPPHGKSLEEAFVFRAWGAREKSTPSSLVPWPLPAIGQTVTYPGRPPDVF